MCFKRSRLYSYKHTKILSGSWKYKKSSCFIFIMLQHMKKASFPSEAFRKCMYNRTILITAFWISAVIPYSPRVLIRKCNGSYQMACFIFVVECTLSNRFCNDNVQNNSHLLYARDTLLFPFKRIFVTCMLHIATLHRLRVKKHNNTILKIVCTSLIWIIIPLLIFPYIKVNC